jgi:hypothetical protein
MIWIEDADGYVDDFGSAGTVEFFADAAKENELPALEVFFTNGFTITPAQAIRELNEIKWPITDGIDEVAERVKSALSKCKGGIAILTQG